MVTIGIDLYTEWPLLQNAVSDATGAHALFLALGFEAIVPPIVDEAATSKRLWKLVTDDLSQLGPGDSLILFFAGHGHTRTRTFEDGVKDKTGYLIPVDGHAPGGEVASWLRLDGWLSEIARLPARHILVILDACHSGIALGSLERWRGLEDEADLDTLAIRRSRRVITSALDNQCAMDSGPVRGHSLFTGCLIEGLRRGFGDGTRRMLTGSEIALHLQREVRGHSRSRQTPDFGTFELDDRGEMQIPMLSATQPAPSPDPPLPGVRPPGPRRRPSRRWRSRLIAAGAIVMLAGFAVDVAATKLHGRDDGVAALVAQVSTPARVGSPPATPPAPIESPPLPAPAPAGSSSALSAPGPASTPETLSFTTEPAAPTRPAAPTPPRPNRKANRDAPQPVPASKPAAPQLVNPDAGAAAASSALPVDPYSSPPAAGSAAPPTTSPVAPRSNTRATFDRARAERMLVDCRLPVDPANPERALKALGGPVADWGPIKKREVLNSPNGPMWLYEIAGRRDLYRFDGASLPRVGVLDAAIGDLVVVCPYAHQPRSSMTNGYPMPPSWSAPSRPIYAFALATQEPRIATELRGLAPLHVPEQALRESVSGISPALATRTLLVWATPKNRSGTRWEMNGWALDVSDMKGLADISAGDSAWFVVDRPRLDGPPGNRHPLLHGVRALRSLLR